MLPNGDMLAGSVNAPNTYIYDPTANTWSLGPAKPDGDASSGESWTQLADGNIMSVDVLQDVGQVEIFNTTTMSWGLAGPNTAPAGLATADVALGPATVLPNGEVFQIGGPNSLTALYDPSTNTWTAGPTLPNGLETVESTAAMLPNGNVLFSAGGTVDGPIHFFEFNPGDDTVTDVSPAFSLTASSQPFVTRMVALPTGQVLAVVPGGAANELYVYTPVGSPQAAWQPTITSVVANAHAEGNYTLTGTQLSGLSAGASQGASINEMASNYPIVELTSESGQVFFARTFNWSSTGVARGSAPETTNFSLPASMPYGTYSLTVVANGIASNPVPFTGGIVNPSADLAVINVGPSASTEGSNVTYSLTVTNNGPTTATNVDLTDTLDPNLEYVSATKSQGSFTQSGSVVTFSLGSINVGQTVTATVTAQAIESGDFTNTASVKDSLSDANLNNDIADATTVVSDPAILVSAPLITSSTTLTDQIVATFGHANGVEPASAFVARINWGDGATSTGVVSLSGTTYWVTGSHTFALSGSHTIITTVVEVPTAPWSQVANLAPPGDLDTMELLSDGSVMVFTTTNAVYKLTPDSTGSYADGTWSQLASMSTARVQYSTNVLPDGRVLVIGGQNTNSGEIYDPVTNTWTSIAALPESSLYNVPTILLANGTVLVGSRVGPRTYIYDPAANAWTAGPTRLFNDQSYGERWIKLADGSILSFDIWNNVGEAQRLDPTSMTWIDSGTAFVGLGVPGKANGPSMLLPDGRVFVAGNLSAINGNSNTAIYTPSAIPGGTGTWVSGPALPDGLEARFSSAALLPNGHVLFAVGMIPLRLFEFDPTAPIATSLTEVTPTAPDLSGQMARNSRMLELPSGQILFEGASNTSELDLYTPSGSPQTAWQPTITSVVPDGTNYTLTGTQLNGLSTGASYSPALEMDSNYPIIELTSPSGLVYFAKTFNWSSTGVATGSTPETTQFALPAGMPDGTYNLSVVANGIASSAVSIAIAENNLLAAQVTSTADSGPGSLRQALLTAAADTSGEPYTIQIDLPAGEQTVNLLSPLPAMTDPLLLSLDATQNVTIAAPAANAWDDFNALTKSGEGTLTLSEAGSFDGEIAVEGGVLQLNEPSTPTIALGVGATVSGDGMIQLAGSLSNLTESVNITNNSTATAGIEVSGANQVVGAIDGTGNLVLDAGSSLTADSVKQNSLVIGDGRRSRSAQRSRSPPAAVRQRIQPQHLSSAPAQRSRSPPATARRRIQPKPQPRLSGAEIPSALGSWLRWSQYRVIQPQFRAAPARCPKNQNRPLVSFSGRWAKTRKFISSGRPLHLSPVFAGTTRR